jgi:hypothetical protein
MLYAPECNVLYKIKLIQLYVHVYSERIYYSREIRKERLNIKQ